MRKGTPRVIFLAVVVFTSSLGFTVNLRERDLGINFRKLQPLDGEAPSTPIDVELRLSNDTLSLGHSSQLICVVSSALDAPFANVQIMLGKGLVIAKGNLSWFGNIPANGMIKMKSVIEASKVGNWTIQATAGFYFTENGWYGDTDILRISVLEDLANIEGSVVAEPKVALEEKLDDPPNVTRELLHEGQTPYLSNGSTLTVSPNSPDTLKITGHFWSYVSEDVLPTPGTKRSDEMQPSAWAAVYIYDGNDDFLGSDITGPKDSIEEGEFEIFVENPGSTGFYVKRKPHTTACHVTRSDDSDYYSHAPASGLFYPDPSNTVYDIGDWVIPNSFDYKGAWRIYESIAQDHYDRGAWDFMVNEGPGYIPPEVQVRFKMPDGHGTHIHLGLGIVDIDTEDYSRALDIVQHEYGHWVMYNAYNGYWPPNTGGTHYINRISNPNMAWTEGWADFFPLAVQSYNRWEDPVFEWGEGSQINLETPTWGTPSWDDGDEVEGRVASALWDVFDSTSEDYDTFADGFLNIWGVLSSQTDATYTEFYSAWRSVGKDRHMLNFCSYQNTINYDISAVLSDGTVDPTSGYTDTVFKFLVKYQDQDNDYATTVYVYVYDEGWYDFAMDHYTGKPIEDEWFIVFLTGFSPGWHNFFFYASNGIDEDYDPDSGYYEFEVKPSQYTITFYTNPIESELSITFDGTTYTHDQTGSYASSTYTATANAPAGYSFHHWEYSGGVYVPNIENNPTTIEVTDDGSLKAVFSALITFHTSPVNVGSITYDGQTFTDGETMWEANLPPDYGNVRTITANVPSGYMFISWETTGRISVSNSSAALTTLTVDGPGVLIVNYQEVFTVTVQTSGLPYSSYATHVYVDGEDQGQPYLYDGISRTFTFISGETHTISVEEYVQDGSEERYHCASNSQSVSSETTITFEYHTEYYLNVEANPSGLDNPRWSDWYDKNTYADIAVDTPTGGDGVSTRYRFDRWNAGIGIVNTTAPSTLILMDAPKTAIAYYVKQYHIIVISAHDSPTSSQWVDKGGSLTVSVISPTEIVLGQTQWYCMGYGVDEGQIQPGSSFTFENVQAPHEIEFYWVQQFWLQVGTVISGSTVEGTGWYDANTSASISAKTPYQLSSTHQFVFTLWTSTGANEAPITDPTSPSTTVTVRNYYTIQANWQEMWYITVVSTHNDPTPSQWINASESLTVSVTSPAEDDGAGTRYRCTGYRIDGGNLKGSTSFTFENVQAPHQIRFEWITQYYLIVETDPIGLNPQPSVSPSGLWYDINTQVTLTAQTLSKYAFDHWTVDEISQDSGVNPITITINEPHTAIAYYTSLPEECSLTITSSPISGVSVSIEDSIHTTPYTNSYTYEITLFVSAPSSVTIEGTTYTFHHWADDQDFSSGSDSILYRVPSISSTKLTAFYISEEDTIPPTIAHTPITTGNEGQAITITATITDNIVVTKAELYYRKKGETTYISVTMTKSDNTYIGTIPSSEVTTVGLQYYINATDGINFSTNPATNPTTSPYTITIGSQDLPPTPVSLWQVLTLVSMTVAAIAIIALIRSRKKSD